MEWISLTPAEDRLKGRVLSVGASVQLLSPTTSATTMCSSVGISKGSYVGVYTQPHRQTQETLTDKLGCKNHSHAEKERLPSGGQIQPSRGQITVFEFSAPAQPDTALTCRPSSWHPDTSRWCDKPKLPGDYCQCFVGVQRAGDRWEPRAPGQQRLKACLQVKPTCGTTAERQG